MIGLGKGNDHCCAGLYARRRVRETARQIMLVTVLSFTFALAGSWGAATFYVRPDGGTARQCSGTVDAPYPGTGTNQSCAWSHPFWALQAVGASAWWRLEAGDTLVIAAGSYKMGYGAPNTGCRSKAYP